jgi:bifunctional non-homologous end joining protein LigD
MTKITIDPIKPANVLRPNIVTALKGKLVVQRKYNGCRCTSTQDEGSVQLWSRSFSKVTGERIPYTGKMPHIVEELSQLGLPEGTVLDGELVSFRGTDSENFKDIKQSTGGHDVTNAEFQKRTGYWATWIVFDCPFYNGQPTHQLPYWDRRQIIVNLFKDKSFKWIRLIEEEPFVGTIESYKEKAGSLGIEGFVVKNIDSIYPITTLGKTKKPPETWWKIKAESYADVIVKGFEYGEVGSKYEKQVGKLQCYQYDDEGALHHICNVGSGLTDQERAQYLSIDYSQPLVGVVKYAYRNENYHLIHPAWKGFRDDKKLEECIIEELT